MVESDALLNLGVKTDRKYFRPSKLIHYLGAGRPLLGISSAGAGANFVDQSGGFVASPRDPEGIAAMLRNVCEAHSAGTLESHCPPARLRTSLPWQGRRNLPGLRPK
jgi:hypothetical protein